VNSAVDRLRNLADLLRETRAAHHRAFLSTNGDDPEWPLWYAEYLKERLEQHFGISRTKSEIVYLLLSAEKEHARRDPGADWPIFYAGFLVSRTAT
jgi:hypothetical protein